MKKIIVIFPLALSSCIYDPAKPKIGVVKNLSKINLILMYGEDSVTDDQLFYGVKYYIDADSTNNIYGAYPKVEKNQKVNFYFFNSDTILKYIKSNMETGIYSKSFLSKQSIELNKLSISDTIFYE
jgi:hypothetical protein